MKAAGIFDTYAVRAQAIKSAVEAACMLLRIDDILSGMKNKKYGDERGGQPSNEDEEGGGPVIGDD
jgi:T-complex protein 1 subunit gamma